VQVDPIKPMLKLPGIKRSKLQCDDLVSNFGFKFNLRRCNEGEGLSDQAKDFILRLLSPEVGAYIHSLLSST
jgi:hypothetical protein